MCTYRFYADEGKPRNIYRIMSKHMLANFKIGQEFSASLAPLQVREDKIEKVIIIFNI